MKPIRTAILLFISLWITTCVVYPAVVTIIAALAFPEQAGGSLIRRADGTVAGSKLLGQPFSEAKYFWSRPSPTADFPYNPMASGGSNLGPTNPDLLKQAAERVKSLQESGFTGPVPAEMVLGSGSGLDPHIGLEAALLQVPRVAKARNMVEERLQQLVQKSLEDRQLGFLGQPRVNVLKLNLALDEAAGK